MNESKIDINMINNICKDTLINHLQIEFKVDNNDNLYAVMPVTKKHLQPMGILHGGSSLALAESLGSAYSYLLVDAEKFNVVGHNLQATHLNPVRKGLLTANCTPIHLGTKTHVLDISIRNENNVLISVCRMTNLILKKTKQ